MQIYHLARGGSDDQQITVRHISGEAVPHGAIFLLGYFDGVHLGHRALFEKAVLLSASLSSPDRSIPVVVWTFEMLPKASAEQGLITTVSEKLRIFASLGADYAVFEEFDDVRSMPGDEFFVDRIASPFSPYCIVCGENFRFGKGASCGHDDLARFSRSAGIRCLVLPLLQAHEGLPISSTAIRRLILDGNLTDANKLLGSPYSVTSAVLHGKEIGRTIGHPTINQRLPREKITPAHGVYTCTVTFDSDGTEITRGGVCNIGSRPTVNEDESDITLETYIFDFTGDLYGKTVTTRLYEMIRPEIAFASVNELSSQIERDAETAKASLEKILQNKPIR